MYVSFTAQDMIDRMVSADSHLLNPRRSFLSPGAERGTSGYLLGHEQCARAGLQFECSLRPCSIVNVEKNEEYDQAQMILPAQLEFSLLPDNRLLASGRTALLERASGDTCRTQKMSLPDLDVDYILSL
jgi:hypothetical protein